MKFGFIAKHRGIWPVAWLCEAMGVSRSRVSDEMRMDRAIQGIVGKRLTYRLAGGQTATA